MTASLEKTVQDYAHDFFAIYVKQEYENIFGNWEIHINKLVKCATVAFRNHEAYLKHIKEEQRARFEFAMLAFSLVSGPLASWVSGKIQYDLVRKLFGTPKTSSSYVVVNAPKGKAGLPKPFGPHYEHSQIKPATRYWVYDTTAHDKAAAKVLGDFGGAVVQALGVNPAIRAMMPPSDALDTQIRLTAESRSLEDFEENMRNALIAAKQYIGTGIVNFAGTIKKDYQYGKNWLARAAAQPSTNPAVGYANDPVEARLRHVLPLVHQACDKQRSTWAKDPNWKYFGQNPPDPLHEARTTNAIEAQIWALWVLSEDFKTIGVGTFGADGEPSGVKYGAGGKSKIALDKILDRLVAIGVVLGRTHDETRKDIKRRYEKGKELGLLDAEVTDIDDEVDSEKELASIRKWAAERKPKLMSGVPRTILSLDFANVPTR
jgi:hypothetical protein